MTAQEECYKDVSGLPNVAERHQHSTVRNWVKLIPHDKTASFDEFDERGYFSKVADIVLDVEMKADGKRKRNTLIKLDNCDQEQVKAKTEWIYLLVINGRISKIGGTRDGIKGRFGSYLCGHHIPEHGKSGKASETNKYIYNTLCFYLELGCRVELYGYQLPAEEIVRNVFSKEVRIRVQTYHSYESILIENYKKKYGYIPYLCDNSDPDYKD